MNVLVRSMAEYFYKPQDTSNYEQVITDYGNSKYACACHRFIDKYRTKKLTSTLDQNLTDKICDLYNRKLAHCQVM